MLYYNFTDNDGDWCGVHIADTQALVDAIHFGGYGGCYVQEISPFYCDCGVAAQFMGE